MKNNSIAFDLDGTLIDVSLRDYKIYTDIVHSLNGTPMKYDVYWSLRKNKTDIFYILEQSGIINDIETNFFLQKRKELMERSEYLKLDVLIPGVATTLEKLAKSYDIYIVTIRYNKENTIEQLHQLGLDKYKLYIASGGKVEYLKKIPNLCVMVGDTENDILPAKKLGIQSVAVLSGIRNKTQLEVMEPSYIIESVSKWDRVLSKILIQP